MRRAIKITAAAALGTLIVAASAEAAVIDPKRPPKVGGALERSGRECERERDPRGAIWVDCRYFYDVNPAVDGNPDRDYAVIWRQVRLVWGGCANHVWSRDVSTPEVRVHRKAPRARVRRQRTRRFTARLNVRAAAGRRVGRVMKRFKLRRGTLRTTLKRRANGRTVIRQDWRGPRCPRSVGLAYGAEYSFPAEAAASASSAAIPTPLERSVAAWRSAEGLAERR